MQTMANSEVFTPNSNNTKWNSRHASSKTLGKGAHAETVLYQYVKNETKILFDQDAFPCGDCDAFLLGKSAGKWIAVRVSEDGSGDRNYHVGLGLPANSGYPCAIYYRNGARSYNAAPNGWPAPPV
jgi:hypothetical protein